MTNPTASQVLSKAASQIGGYFPGKSPYGIWYGQKTKTAGFDEAAFCAMGLSWVFDQVDGQSIFPFHAYTPAGVNWFKSKKKWHNGVSGIRRGDVVFFDFPGAPNRVSHVGIVESVNSDGSVNTIEFNTSGTAKGDQRNGRVVARKRRKAYIVGYGRPAYGAGTTPKPVKSWKGALDITDIKPGDTGADVKTWQTFLKKHGFYKGALDSSFGPQTEKATVAFQKKVGLTGDAQVGENTQKKAKAYTSATTVDNPKTPATPSKPTKKVDVTDLQKAVHAKEDNNWGPDTDARLKAVREVSVLGGGDFPYGARFAQKAVGTKADGDWGPNSIKAHDKTVSAVQKALKELGYYKGKIDTKWGPQTDAAWKAARSDLLDR